MSRVEWPKISLKELCFKIGDGIHGTPNYQDKTDLYFINGNNLKNGHIEINENTKSVSKEDFQTNYIELNQNSLLISINGTIGSMAFFKGENIMLGKSSAYLNFKSEINKFYYYYFQLNEIQKQFYKIATGSTIKNLSLKSLQNFEVPYPDKIEWKKISEVLFSLDNKIELNRQINAELEQMAKLLYDYWFVQFDFPYDFEKQEPSLQGKPYKSSGGTMVYNNELKREIPEGWEVKTIGRLANIIDPHPSHRAPKEVSDGFPFAGIGDIDEFGNIDVSKARIINKDFVNKQERDYEINDGSIGYGRVGTVGKVVRLRKQSFRYALSPTMAIVNPINVSHFIYFIVKDKTFFKEALKRTSGTTRPAIGIMELRKIPIVVPREDKILHDFQNKVNSQMNLIENQNRQNQRLTTLRDWLLPMLMNGQVSVAQAKEKLKEVGIAAEPQAEYK